MAIVSAMACVVREKVTVTKMTTVWMDYSVGVGCQLKALWPLIIVKQVRYIFRDMILLTIHLIIIIMCLRVLMSSYGKSCTYFCCFYIP